MKKYEVWAIVNRKGIGNEEMILATDNLEEAREAARDQEWRDALEPKTQHVTHSVEIRTEIREANGGYDYELVPYKISEDLQEKIASYMRDDIREDVHGDLAPCTPEEFDREYLKRDPEFRNLMADVFPEVLELLDE